jgi:hypothetical protein
MSDWNDEPTPADSSHESSRSLGTLALRVRCPSSDVTPLRRTLGPLGRTGGPLPTRCRLRGRRDLAQRTGEARQIAQTNTMWRRARCLTTAVRSPPSTSDCASIASLRSYPAFLPLPRLAPCPAPAPCALSRSRALRLVPFPRLAPCPVPAPRCPFPSRSPAPAHRSRHARVSPSPSVIAVASRPCPMNAGYTSAGPTRPGTLTRDKNSSATGFGIWQWARPTWLRHLRPPICE